MNLPAILLATCLAIAAQPAAAGDLSISLGAAASNPKSPQMGDHLTFQSVIRNQGHTAVDGLIAWLSLVRVDKGKEHPVGLEDWSAEKAVTVPSLTPGQAVRTDWPMRLIQEGHYRVVVSAVSRDGQQLTASPFANFAVRRKPVVESARVLPVAFGVPLLIALTMIWRRYRA